MTAGQKRYISVCKLQVLDSVARGVLSKLTSVSLSQLYRVNPSVQATKDYVFRENLTMLPNFGWYRNPGQV